MNKSSNEKWSTEEDEALVAAVQNASMIDWIAISELAFPTGTRNGTACRSRWTNRLNPVFSVKDITQEQEQSIVEDFHFLGFKFESFKSDHASYKLKTFLYHYVCKLYDAGGGVCFFLYQKLATLLLTNSEVTLKQWLDESIVNPNHYACVRLIIVNNVKFLANWFGIAINNHICRVEKLGWYQRGQMIKRRPFPMTAADKDFVRNLIADLQTL